MSVTVDLSADEVAQIKRFTDLDNSYEAIGSAKSGLCTCRM